EFRDLQRLLLSPVVDEKTNVVVIEGPGIQNGHPPVFLLDFLSGCLDRAQSLDEKRFSLVVLILVNVKVGEVRLGLPAQRAVGIGGVNYAVEIALCLGKIFAFTSNLAAGQQQIGIGRVSLRGICFSVVVLRLVEPTPLEFQLGQIVIVNGNSIFIAKVL